MNKVLMRTVIICLAVASTAAAIPLLIENPGAETGDTTGWTNPNGIYYASSSTPRDGSWAFETDEYLNLAGQDLDQLIDVSAYTGQIDDVVLSVSMAADYGYAEQDGPEGMTTWNYYASAGITLYDSAMQFLSGSGPVEFGSDATQWMDRTHAASAASNWDSIKSQVAYVRVVAGGAWLNNEGGTFEDPPLDAIVDTPDVTRFDSFGLELVPVPEPSSLAMLMGGLLVATLRRRA